MSKFIERLTQVSQASPPPIGFGTSKAVVPKATMLLVASLAENDAERLIDYLSVADAVLLDISDLPSGTKTLGSLCQKLPDLPCGGRVQDIDSEGIKQLTKAGSDFLVFPAGSASLAILQNDEIGRVLEVETSLSEGLLRTIDDLPVDAVLIADEGEKSKFTWRRLMVFQRFSNLLSTLLLASLPLNTSNAELQTVWGAGVDGVVVRISPDQPIDRLKELRQAIGKLTLPPPRKPLKREALVPYFGGERRAPAEEEEEEE